MLTFCFSQYNTCFTEVKNSLHASNSSLNDQVEVQEASGSAPLTDIDDSKLPKK